MNLQRAFLGGMLGAAVMSLLMAIGRRLGAPFELETMLGTLVGLRPGVSAFLLGTALHLLIGGFVGLLYGWGFERVAHRSGWLPGLLFSMIHTVVAGLALGQIGALHPLIPDRVSPPGAFFSGLGEPGVVGFALMHAAFGIVVGSLYGKVREPVARKHDRDVLAGHPSHPPKSDDPDYTS